MRSIQRRATLLPAVLNASAQSPRSQARARGMERGGAAPPLSRLTKTNNWFEADIRVFSPRSGASDDRDIAEATRRDTDIVKVGSSINAEDGDGRYTRRERQKRRVMATREKKSSYVFNENSALFKELLFVSPP